LKCLSTFHPVGVSHCGGVPFSQKEETGAKGVALNGYNDKNFPVGLGYLCSAFYFWKRRNGKWSLRCKQNVFIV